MCQFYREVRFLFCLFLTRCRPEELIKLTRVSEMVVVGANIGLVGEKPKKRNLHNTACNFCYNRFVEIQ